MGSTVFVFPDSICPSGHMNRPPLLWMLLCLPASLDGIAALVRPISPVGTALLTGRVSGAKP